MLTVPCVLPDEPFLVDEEDLYQTPVVAAAVSAGSESTTSPVKDAEAAAVRLQAHPYLPTLTTFDHNHARHVRPVRPLQTRGIRLRSLHWPMLLAPIHPAWLQRLSAHFAHLRPVHLHPAAKMVQFPLCSALAALHSGRLREEIPWNLYHSHHRLKHGMKRTCRCVSWGLEGKVGGGGGRAVAKFVRALCNVAPLPQSSCLYSPYFPVSPSLSCLPVLPMYPSMDSCPCKYGLFWVWARDKTE